MIKRSDGVEIMNARTKNVKIARETLDIVKQGHYVSPNGNQVDISQLMATALQGTVLDKTTPSKKDYSNKIRATIEVTNETTAQAAVRLSTAGKENIVALNFASARNQGGGFLAAALAQEEDLCRCSGLYPCLKTKPVFYNENILRDDTLYTHNMIYTPKVPFFRNEHNLLLEDPFTLSIISAPAPNLTSMSADYRNSEDGENDIYSTIYNRMEKILQIAEQNGHKNIILGAWGCGAFGNDPEQIALITRDVLVRVPCFEHVCFAVYDTREPPVLFETFQRKFSYELPW